MSGPPEYAGYGFDGSSNNGGIFTGNVRYRGAFEYFARFTVIWGGR
jgi:hypothetical protein